MVHIGDDAIADRFVAKRLGRATDHRITISYPDGHDDAKHRIADAGGCNRGGRNVESLRYTNHATDESTGGSTKRTTDDTHNG